MSKVHPTTAKLLAACPFVREQTEQENLKLPTVVFGDAARLLRDQQIDPQQRDTLFAFFNELAEEGTADELEILGTGAIETLNDGSTIQRLAKQKLTGKARRMLDEFRTYWGQPDYG